MGCTINDLGLNKPLTCELYPFHIKKIQNFYIVSFTPCPTFQLNLGEGQRYKDIEDVVLRYIKTGVPVFSPSLHVSEERLKYEIEYQNNFKNTYQSIIEQRLPMALQSLKNMKNGIYII